MSTRPRRLPRISTTPRVGHRAEPTTRSNVVFPDPLGPSNAHRSPVCTSQSMPSINAVPSRTTLSPATRMTMSVVIG
jgi:hypothetical protein